MGSRPIAMVDKTEETGEMLPECFLFVGQRTHFEGSKVLEPRLLIQYDGAVLHVKLVCRSKLMLMAPLRSLLGGTGENLIL